MERTSPDLLQRWLLSESITVAFVPTVLAPTLCELSWPASTALRLLLTGGDTLHKRPASGLPFHAINNYGAHGVHVVATSGAVASGLASTPSIGVAIEGASVYLLDEECLACRAWRHRRALCRWQRRSTRLSQSSRAHRRKVPARSLLNPPGRAHVSHRRPRPAPSRWRDEFRGRTDTQEKIRRQRVELDEISSVLNRHPKLSAALVTTFTNDEQEKVLLAYVVPSGSEEPTSVELQHFIAEHLPAYMVPSSFARLQAFPLTVNGKIDRAALPPIDDCTLLSAVAVPHLTNAD